MSHAIYGTANDSRLRSFFRSVFAASLAAVLLYGMFFAAYLHSRPDLVDALWRAATEHDFVTMQHVLETVDDGVMSVTGWVRLALGLALFAVSVLFMLNIGGTIFGVFIDKPFSAGGTVSRSWLRLSLSRLYLTLKLLLFIALYKAAGLRGLTIIREFFSQSPIVGITFFLSSVLNLGTLIVLASVIKVVVYELNKYELLVEQKRHRVLSAMEDFSRRWKNAMIMLEEGRLSDDPGYIKAKLEDAMRNLRKNIRLLESAQGELNRLASPEPIIKRLMVTFAGVIALQVAMDFILYVGWGTVLTFVFGLLNGTG